MSLRENLLDIYRNSDNAYTGEWALYTQAKQSGLKGVTLKKVRNFLRTKPGWIQQKRIPKNFKRSKVFAKGVNELFEADITYLTQNKMPHANRNYKYLLTAIGTRQTKLPQLFSMYIQ